MKKDFNKLILKDLYKSINGLYPYTMFSRYNIEPNYLFKFIKKYTENNFIIYENDKMFLTEYGKKKIYKELFRQKKFGGLESNLPDNYRGEKIEIDVPYIPIIDYFSKNN